MYTNIRFTPKWSFWVILTHWLTSSIESKSLRNLENFFQSKNISTLAFDIYGHWKSDWTIEDLALTKCYEQALSCMDIFHENNIVCKYSYWTSFSTLPILKFGCLIEEVEYIIFKTPVFDYYKKRVEDIWGEKNMIEWQNKWIMQTGFNERENKPILQKYVFIEDYQKNFSNYNELLSKKKIIIWAGIDDEEVNVDELREISELNKNIALIEYEENHRFSKESMDKFCLDISKKINIS